MYKRQAQAAQALHAGTIRQQLTDGEDDPNQQGQTVEPVSYTHLDVYKRQRWSRKKAGFQKFLVADRKQKYIFFVSTSKKGGVLQ